MKAIYNGKVGLVQDDDGESVQLKFKDGSTMNISFAHPSLIIDPTDGELEELMTN